MKSAQFISGQVTSLSGVKHSFRSCSDCRPSPRDLSVPSIKAAVSMACSTVKGRSCQFAYDLWSLAELPTPRRLTVQPFMATGA